MPEEKHKEHLSSLSASAFLCRSSSDPEITRDDIFVVGVTQVSVKEHLLAINILLKGPPRACHLLGTYSYKELTGHARSQRAYDLICTCLEVVQFKSFQ